MKLLTCVFNLLPLLLLVPLTQAAPGNLDLAFDPHIEGGGFTYVNAVATQPDGKLLVGGCFTSVGGVTHYDLARLNANGTRDPGFHATLGVVYCIAVQADGKILVCGTLNAISSLLKKPHAKAAKSAKESLFRGTLRPWREASSGISTGC